MVTVASKPSGAPMAMTSWPRRSFLESPSLANGALTGCSTLSTAMSVSGSSPIGRAVSTRPSAVITARREKPPTTWLLVTISPSADTKKPEPSPAKLPSVVIGETRTTEGPTISTALTTASE